MDGTYGPMDWNEASSARRIRLSCRAQSIDPTRRNHWELMFAGCSSPARRRPISTTAWSDPGK
jgi:hypothetical protein